MRKGFLVMAVLWATVSAAAAQGKKDPADDPAPPQAAPPAAPAAPPPVPAAPPTFSMQIYGPGTISCATYLGDRSMRINADGWILGFWTGSNRKNAETHAVGQSTDSRGIVGEVALACRGRPSATLFQTVSAVYDRMKGENR